MSSIPTYLQQIRKKYYISIRSLLLWINSSFCCRITTILYLAFIEILQSIKKQAFGIEIIWFTWINILYIFEFPNLSESQKRERMMQLNFWSNGNEFVIYINSIRMEFKRRKWYQKAYFLLRRTVYYHISPHFYISNVFCVVRSRLILFSIHYCFLVWIKYLSLWTEMDESYFCYYFYLPIILQIY